MNARFKVVYFVSDPVMGGRVPVGAILAVGNERRFVRAQHIPGSHCLGGAAMSATLRMILSMLEKAPTLDASGRLLGPHALLGGLTPVPDHVVDPENWVSRLLSPGAAPSEVDDARNKRAPHRATLGYRFFENFKVADYVQKTFEPQSDFNGLFDAASALGSISQFVTGKSDLILLEPIIPARPTLADDVRSIAKLFGAYKTAMRKVETKVETAFVVYVLDGGTARDISTVRADLKHFADYIYDTSHLQDRSTLLTAIRETGASGGRPPMLN